MTMWEESNEEVGVSQGYHEEDTGFPSATPSVENRFYYVVSVGFELITLLPLPVECWNDRYDTTMPSFSVISKICCLVCNGETVPLGEME